MNTKPTTQLPASPPLPAPPGSAFPLLPYQMAFIQSCKNNPEGFRKLLHRMLWGRRICAAFYTNAQHRTHRPARSRFGEVICYAKWIWNEI
jgi:hypothetical protein